MTDWVSILEPGEADRARTVEVCDLPVQDGAFIRFRAVYTGFQEYWGLYPLEPCSDNPSDRAINFETRELWLRFENQRAFRALRSLSDGGEAVVDVIGTFESSELGYGHLGSNYAEIDVKAFRVVEVVRRSWAA